MSRWSESIAYLWKCLSDTLLLPTLSLSLSLSLFRLEDRCDMHARMSKFRQVCTWEMRRNAAQYGNSFRVQVYKLISCSYFRRAWKLFKLFIKVERFRDLSMLKNLRLQNGARFR